MALGWETRRKIRYLRGRGCQRGCLFSFPQPSRSVLFRARTLTGRGCLLPFLPPGGGGILPKLQNIPLFWGLGDGGGGAETLELASPGQPPRTHLPPGPRE